jgi:hemerythrin superfamily protein
MGDIREESGGITVDTRADIYTRLHHDHETVADIMRRLMQTDATHAVQRQALFTELKHHLSQHSEAEDEVFYAPLLTHSDTRDLIRDGQEEHQRIETLLEELEQMHKDDALWGARLHTLKGVVEHHVHEEEEKVFPKARHIFTTQRAEELGQQFEQAKAQHPPRTAQATASARQAGARVAHEAQRFADAAKERGRSILDDQQHFFASQIGGVAAALHRTAQQLGEEDQQGMAQYVNQAAAGLERFSHTLRDRNLSSLVGQVENFARQQPVAFIGSAALVGFLAARFLKSSAGRSHPAYHPPSASAESNVGSYTEAMAPSPAYSAIPGTAGRETPATTPSYGATGATSAPEQRGTSRPNGGN